MQMNTKKPTAQALRPIKDVISDYVQADGKASRLFSEHKIARQELAKISGEMKADERIMHLLNTTGIMIDLNKRISSVHGIVVVEEIVHPPYLWDLGNE
jgi:hypothetical protein